MMATVVFILVVAVALLAALCFRQSRDIKSKKKKLAMFIKENIEMKAEIRRLNRVIIEDKYMHLLDNDELTQSLKD